jgi:hypothetical protein
VIVDHVRDPRLVETSPAKVAAPVRGTVRPESFGPEPDPITQGEYRRVKRARTGQQRDLVPTPREPRTQGGDAGNGSARAQREAGDRVENLHPALPRSGSTTLRSRRAKASCPYNSRHRRRSARGSNQSGGPSRFKIEIRPAAIASDDSGSTNNPSSPSASASTVPS